MIASSNLWYETIIQKVNKNFLYKSIVKLNLLGIIVSLAFRNALIRIFTCLSCISTQLICSIYNLFSLYFCIWQNKGTLFTVICRSKHQMAFDFILPSRVHKALINLARIWASMFALIRDAMLNHRLNVKPT